MTDTLWTVWGEQLASVPLLSRKPSSIPSSFQEQLSNQTQREKWMFLSWFLPLCPLSFSPPMYTPMVFCTCTPKEAVLANFWGKEWIPAGGNPCSFLIKIKEVVYYIPGPMSCGTRIAGRLPVERCHCKVWTRYRNWKLWERIPFPDMSRRNKGLDINQKTAQKRHIMTAEINLKQNKWKAKWIFVQFTRSFRYRQIHTQRDIYNLLIPQCIY